MKFPTLFKKPETQRGKLMKCTLADTPYYSLKDQTKLSKVMSVYDGDSVTIATVINNVPTMFRCRLEGVDTPELKPRLGIENRESHVVMAKRARNRVAQMVTNCDVDLGSMDTKLDVSSNTKLIEVKCGKFDKYGRLLISIPHHSKTVSDILIEEQLGKPYYGGTKL